MSDGLFPDLPKQPAPPKPKPIRCKFCRSAIPPENEGGCAWRICEECWVQCDFHR